MKLFKKLNSIQGSLLLHELSYVLLIVVTASVGTVWAYAWQNSSEESLRLTAMNSHVQNIRGELYRQLKEVFDAVFLHDADAADEYRFYTDNINNYLQALSDLHEGDEEIAATQGIVLAYAEFQQETHKLLTPINLTNDQRYLLDKQLERFTFTKLEVAFNHFENLLESKQQALAKSRNQWVNRITLLAPVPVLLAISLLLFSRRYVRKDVLAPLAEVMQGAKLISKGDLEHSIPLMGVDELVRLAKAINSMAVELATNRDKLVEAKQQAALGELIPLVAHNIRNPLAGIRAASQVTLDDNLSPETRDALNDIIMAVDRLERWVTSLLTYLHPLKPHFSDARLTELADEVLTMMTLQLNEKDLSVSRENWDVPVTTVELDRNLIEQTIFNLLQNAIEASPQNGNIQLIYQQTGEQVELQIKDQGNGMRFDPVGDEKNDSESKRLNCGLGIPFSLKVIKQHGGSLTYSACEPHGTAATIILPTDKSAVAER